ncbi:unnamed protein product [Prunus armeniaca]
MRALANVDPIDVARSIARLNPETTLIVVVSKTFTTAETMLNARTLREWINFIFSWVSAVPTLLQVYEQVVSV